VCPDFKSIGTESLDKMTTHITAGTRDENKQSFLL